MTDAKQQMHSGTDAAAEATRKGVDAAEKAAHGMVNKVGDLADMGKEAVSQLVDQAGDMGHKVQRWAGGAYEAAADKVKEGVDGTTDLIRQYPIPALLVGFGVGLVIGRLLRV